MRREDAVVSSEAAEAAAGTFLDVSERRGLTEETTLMWNVMAFICYEQVQNRQDSCDEAFKPLLAGGEA